MSNDRIQALKSLIQICLLRVGPETLPASPKLFVRSLIAYLLTGVLALTPMTGLPVAVGEALFDIALMMTLLYAAFAWRRLPARFLQTAMALAGTGALFGLLLLPVLGLSNSGGGAEALASWLWLLLFGWSLAVTGHILRAAFEIPLPLGVLAAALYFALSLALIQSLFPVMA